MRKVCQNNNLKEGGETNFQRINRYKRNKEIIWNSAVFH